MAENLLGNREKINDIALSTLNVLKSGFDGFMKHDLNIVANALKEEQKLDEAQKVITQSLLDISKGQAADADKKNIALLISIICDMEMIGDYIKNLNDRIEVKIKEKLFFTHKSLTEYKGIYSSAENILTDIVSALKSNDKNIAQRVVNNQENIDELGERYKDAHSQRLIMGVCDIRAGGVFLHMIDYIAQIHRRAKVIAKNILKLS